MSNGNGVTPIFGAKPRIGVQYITVLVRHLDPDGTYEAASVQQAANGQMMAINGREQYLTADDLLREIRQIVREEIAAAGGLTLLPAV